MQSWVWLAIVSALLFGLGDFIVVYSEQQQLNVVTLYITYTIIIGLLNVLYLYFFRRQSINEILQFNRTDWLIVAGLCVTYLGAYLLHFVAIQQAPNPGYANALVMFHLVVLTGLSYTLLNKPLTAPALAGIALMFAGGYLVSVYA